MYHASWMRGDEHHSPEGAPVTAPARVEGAVLRAAAGHFATGVAVITTVHDDEPYGFAANAFCSLSLDPPLVLVCAARSSRTRTALVASGGFAVNVLAADQRDVVRAFGSRDGTRFTSVPWQPGALGNPHITGALAFIDCTVASLLPGGDHVIFTGLVAAAEAREADPILFYRGAFHTLGGAG